MTNFRDIFDKTCWDTRTYHIPKAANAALAIARRQLQHIEPFDFD